VYIVTIMLRRVTREGNAAQYGVVLTWTGLVKMWYSQSLTVCTTIIIMFESSKFNSNTNMVHVLGRRYFGVAGSVPLRTAVFICLVVRATASRHTTSTRIKWNSQQRSADVIQPCYSELLRYKPAASEVRYRSWECDQRWRTMQNIARGLHCCS
jgi:hypothetical protein